VPDRREMLEGAVIEAARVVMAQTLMRERRIGVLADMTTDEAEALQTLRDALLCERKARAS
jgi:hypothetical protein